MLSNNMLEKLNAHMNIEFGAAYEYLSMSAYCGSKDMKGFARWFELQAKEELEHAMLFFRYVEERLHTPILLPINKPKSDYQSFTSVFQTALKNEQNVTARIHALVDLATEEKDHATNNFLQWFVKEQVEEESNVQGILNKLLYIEENKAGIMFLDSELGRRADN